MFNFPMCEYEIIDAHIHPAAGDKASDYTLFGERNSVESMVATLKRAGISRAAGSVIRMLRGEQLTWENIHALNIDGLQAAKNSDGFIIPGITVHPAFLEESLAEIEYMYHSDGVCLIGELVAYLMDYNDYAVETMDPIWDLACQLGMVVNLHLNNLEEAEKILQNFPELKLIIAHPTASVQEFCDRMKLVARYPNAALDISGSGPNSWGMLKYGIKTAGCEKLIFGSDFPIRNPGMYVAGVLFENLSDDENAAIFAGNFKRLMGL